MANRWENNGNSEKLYFLGPQITADGDCNHEITRCFFFFFKKSLDKPRQHIKNQRHYFAEKAPYIKAIVFRVLKYGCGCCTITKAENQRTHVFKLWWWRKLLRVSWTTVWSKLSMLRKLILNIHWKDWCWSWSPNTLAEILLTRKGPYAVKD